MKNKLRIITLLMLCTLLLVACGVPGGGSCQHRDANDDRFCDLCNMAYTDGTDISVCKHRDENDDTLCDKCNEPYEDGKDIPDTPACQHRDADDNAFCDNCGAAYDDGKEAPEENHVDADFDHACDCGCDARFGTHWDIDKNHVCDYGCSELLGVHDDLDKDHACDYCTGNIGECLDVDKNHACDYGCAKTFGMHLDENFDHVCDYGCELSFGAHLDENKDHACDYGCSVTIGDHNANGMDGTCDYCGEIFVHDCMDADKTHLCDVCGASLSECEDLAPIDHLCDLCRETVSECVDDDRDHECDINCGKKFGTHADTDKNGTCDYCETEIDHDCVDDDLDHWCDYGCEDAYFGECTDNDRDSKCDYGCGQHYCWDQDEDSYCDFGCGRHFCYDYDRDHFCDFDCGEYLGEHRFNGVTHFCDYCGERMTECYDVDPLDHNCDLCGERFSECYDDSDHLCDVCGECLGECFDDDCDHDCDVCSSILSECIDDNDHLCDICFAIISECINEVFDHKCDICGQILILDCIDDDCDHYCDYAGCGERVSSCEDIYPRDHKCDLCGEVLSECADADFDHKCDLLCDNYDKFYETHVDENKDHICDAYGAQCVQGSVSECIDEYPFDHNCDICGKTVSVCEDADSDHKCDLLCDNYDKFYETHVDENKDHICDAYGEQCLQGSIGTCEDADNDGFCDHGCGKQFEIEADVPLYTREGDYIYFGEYPQTIKADDVTITETQDSRGYFLGSDGCYYAKVVASPYDDYYSFSNETSITYDAVYYFKVEPLRWRILSEDGVRAFIVCDSIISKMAYQPNFEYSNGGYYTTANGAPEGTYANNYEFSEIRAWLNAQFYETAFSGSQRELIIKAIVDNSAASTGEYSNPCAGENTEDNIFLLSYVEMKNSTYGFASNVNTKDAARRFLTSDYARAKGVWMSTATDSYGNGYWWLRSPSSSGMSVGIVDDFGNAGTTEHYYFGNINRGLGGVVPALRIQLIVPEDKCYVKCDKDGTANENGDYILFGEYPQTLKKDNVTITETQDSRGYFLGSDGCYYAKVIANPYESGYRFSDNTYLTSNETYYFKVEPIRWRILSTDGENALILCDSIIANMEYQSSYDNIYCTTANGAPAETYASNYMYSEVRAWLNATFYASAFSDLQKEIMLTTLVDNSPESAGNVAGVFACEDTQDKIFLLSLSEVLNTEYGFTNDWYDCTIYRRMWVSDYARATGARISTERSYYGNGYWWLRSPNNAREMARDVGPDGQADISNYIYSAENGVVPALWICL